MKAKKYTNKCKECENQNSCGKMHEEHTNYSECKHTDKKNNPFCFRYTFSEICIECKNGSNFKLLELPF
jgi:hypothetical protein